LNAKKIAQSNVPEVPGFLVLGGGGEFLPLGDIPCLKINK
jgi:hypothetical protein